MTLITMMMMTRDTYTVHTKIFITSVLTEDLISFKTLYLKKYNHNSNQYKRHCCEPIQRYIFSTIKKSLSCFSVGN